MNAIDPSNYFSADAMPLKELPTAYWAPTADEVAAAAQGGLVALIFESPPCFGYSRPTAIVTATPAEFRDWGPGPTPRRRIDAINRMLGAEKP
ncbi:hypothetical protein GCM10007913_11410 [Devosia yakushimensis]|uniref:Uncharacterized protein n=1 Tax=Devosia yakushimensis TaxID=470028 RepID=A0ABQ5UBG7_9HYPH|nr:hypothetical protein [Devosia yakushimensis]GLQ09209.1 hypothetical protein GCM10007913_11410 [Devosia yakushimensis]